MIEVSRGKIASVTTGLQLRHSSRNRIIATPTTDLLPLLMHFHTPFSSRLISLCRRIYSTSMHMSKEFEVLNVHMV